MRQVTLHLLLLVAISSAIFFTNLGTARLWDRDEPRNAGCAAEMLARGDWVVPTFNDELRHQKPVLLYWLMMGAYSVFGQSEFAARFWSATLAVGSVLATYGIAARLTRPLVGLVAGIVLSTNLMFDVAARAATPDSVLIFCSTMAIWIYIAGTFAAKVDGETELRLKQPNCWFPQNQYLVAAFYSMLGLGVLAKGPIGFLLPMAIIGLFMMMQSQTKRDGQLGGLSIIPVHFLKTFRSMRPVVGAIVVLLIAAPWYVLVDARTEGDFTRMFFVGEHFGRATSAMENHSGGLWFYPLAILVGFFPWSMFWGPVAISIWNHRHHVGRLTNGEMFCLIWIGLQVGVFSLAQTKLPSYVTPCYPALSILTALCLVRWTERESTLARRWVMLAFSALIVGGLLVSTGLGIAAIEFFPQQRWLLLLGLIPILGGIVSVWQLFQAQRQRVLMTTMASSILFCFLMFGFGTVAIDSVQQSQLVLEPIAAADENQIVAAYRTLESSWVYYGQKPIYECDVESGVRPQNSLDRRNWWQPKPRLTPEALAKLDPDMIFITTDEHLAELQQRLPAEFEISQTAEYFLKKNRHLVTLCRPTGVSSAARSQFRLR